MFFGFVTGILGFVSNFLAFPFGAISYFLTEIIIRVVEFSASLPFTKIQIGHIPTFIIILCYSLYAVGFHSLKKEKGFTEQS